MKKLFDPTISRKTKRAPASIAGFYTTPEAAEKLGVDPATLRYRRDTADAKAYWEMLGVTITDEMNKHLAASHMLNDGHHYYERKPFDKFVKMYLKRPEVIRARKRFKRFPEGKQTLMQFSLTSPADVKKLADRLTVLLKTDGAISGTIYGE